MAKKSTGVPVRFEGCTLSDYDTALGPRSVRDDVRAYIDGFDGHRKTGRGVLLLGAPGRGKTMLGCMILNEVVAKGYNAYFTTLAGYIKRIQSTFDLKSAWEKMQDPEAYEEWLDTRAVLKSMRNDVDLLVVDDVGKEHLTASRFAEDEFDFLVRYRFDRGLPMVMSTNTPVREWGERYGKAMESFIHEAFELIVADGEDVRRAGR